MAERIPSQPTGEETMILTLRPAGEERDIEESMADEESIFARDPFGKLIRVDRPTEQDLAKSVRIKVDGSDWFDVPKAVPATDAQGNIKYHEDGTTVVRATTIYDAAKRMKPPKLADDQTATRIPILCHQDHQTPVAVCRACVVQIVSIDPRDPTKKKEQRKLLPACQHRVEEGMEIHTLWSPDTKFRKTVRSSVQTLYELLAGDHCHPERDQELRHRDGKFRNELIDLGDTLRANWSAFAGDAHMPREIADRDRVCTGLAPLRFTPKPPNPELLIGWVDDLPDSATTDMTTVSRAEAQRVITSPPFVVDHNNCILCDRCIRACSEVKPFKVIGRSGKGPTTQIAFDLRSLPMAESSCRACGECMTACPSGAISFQYRVMDASPNRLAQVLDAATTTVESEELLQHPLFGRMSKAFLEWNRGAVRRRLVEPGDVIAEEGEYGTTAFIIEEGYVAVCRRGAKAPAYLPNSEKAQVASGVAQIPVKYGPALFVQAPEPNEPVGEMAPMSHARRNATLIAVTPGSVLEIDRNVLFVMLRDPKNRDKLDRLYAQRALFEILPRLAQGTGLFGCLSPEEVKALTGYVAPSAQVVRAQPNYVICREGEPADEFYLIRLGFVGLSSQSSGGWLRPPMRQGDSFGEVAFLTRIWPTTDKRLPAFIKPGIRSATCTALDHAELIRVPGDGFAAFLKKPENAATFQKLRDQCIRVYGGTV